MMTREPSLLPDIERLLGGFRSEMPADAYKEGGAYVLLFDLPGCDPDGIDVTIESGVLTVTAQRDVEESDDVTWVMRERLSGQVTRQVSLDDDLDPVGVEAAYESGVLRVRIPVEEAARPRRIEVRGPMTSIGTGTAA